MMFCLKFTFPDGKTGDVIGDTDSLSTVYFCMKLKYPDMKFRLMQLGNNCFAEIAEDGMAVPWFRIPYANR